MQHSKVKRFKFLLEHNGCLPSRSTWQIVLRYFLLYYKSKLVIMLISETIPRIRAFDNQGEMLQQSLLLTTVMMFLQLISTGFSSGYLFFSVYKSKYERSHTGILLSSYGNSKVYNHSNDGVLCRENRRTSIITPSLESAHIICMYANGHGNDSVTFKYHRAEWVADTGYGRFIDHQYYTFNWTKNLPITYEDIVCYADTTTGGHKCSMNGTTTNCVGGYTRTASISAALAMTATSERTRGVLHALRTATTTGPSLDVPATQATISI